MVVPVKDVRVKHLDNVEHTLSKNGVYMGTCYCKVGIESAYAVRMGYDMVVAETEQIEE